MFRKMLLLGAVSALFALALAGPNFTKDIAKSETDIVNSVIGKIAPIEQNEVNIETQLEEFDALKMDGAIRINNYESQEADLYRGVATPDTMAYCASSGGQFIMDSGDVMVTFYHMPADGDVMGVNIPVFEWPEEGGQLDVSLWSVTYPEGKDGTDYSLGSVDGAGWLGYGWDGCDHGAPHPTEGEWYGDSEGETGVCDGDAPNLNAQNPLDERVWPQGFATSTLTPGTAEAQTPHWIANTDGTALLSGLSQGDVFAVVVENTSELVGAASTTGFYYCEGDGLVEPWVSAKFYATECGGTGGNAGWYIRHWVFDYPVAVSLTGDRGPVIAGVTELPTTLSTDAREVSATVTDDNPAGGAAGLASVTLTYYVDDDTVGMDVVMAAGTTDTTANIYTGSIPGQAAGADVCWHLTAVDVADYETETTPSCYQVFENTSSNLFMYNASTYGSFIQGYYLNAVDTTFAQTADWWSFGKAEAALLNNYTTVVEVNDGGGNSWCTPDSVMSAWLDSGNKNWVIAGDEWMGGCVDGWSATTFSAGDFVHDYLGMASSVPDMNYVVSGDQGGISRIMPVAGDTISGALATYLSDNSGAGADSALYLNHDPNGILGVSNWIDGATAVAGTNVSFTGYAGVLTDTTVYDTASTEHAVGLYKEHSNGSKTAWFGFDLISITVGPASSWVGIAGVGPLPQTLHWMGIGDSGSIAATAAPSWPEPAVDDCAGVSGGPGVELEDGSCCASGVVDCAGACDGTAMNDACGNCGGDCTAVLDECGEVLSISCGESVNNTSLADGCGVCYEGGDTNAEWESTCELSLESNAMPTEYSLDSIYPNPFNPTTNIMFGLPENANVQVNIYDIMGRHVETLVDGFEFAGYHSLQWDASTYPSGLYMVSVTSGTFSKTQKIILMK